MIKIIPQKMSLTMANVGILRVVSLRFFYRGSLPPCHHLVYLTGWQQDLSLVTQLVIGWN